MSFHLMLTAAATAAALAGTDPKGFLGTDFQIDSWVLASGGGYATDSGTPGYALLATIGQAEAGAMAVAGGVYAFSGGYWLRGGFANFPAGALFRDGFESAIARLGSLSTTAKSLDTGIRFQGGLSVSGKPANGLFDLQYQLYGSASGADALSPLRQITDLEVTNGHLVADLVPGEDIDGRQVWLALAIRPAGDPGIPTALSPRQKLLAAPYALFAQNAAPGVVGSIEIANGTVMAADLGPASVDTAAIAQGAVTSRVVADGSITSSLLADQSIGSSELAPGAVGALQIAPGSIGINAIDSTAVQHRIEGLCDQGAVAVGADLDGTLRCREIPRSTTSVLDSDATSGRIGVAVRPGGLPIISYQKNLNLYVFDCADERCLDGESHLADPGNGSNVGLHSSVAIRPGGLPIISYQDFGRMDLRVFDCFDTGCSSGAIRTLDSEGNKGAYADITVRSSGLPIVSYYDATADDLRIFDCADSACASGTARVLDSGGDVGQYTSIAVGESGLPVISYYDATQKDLKAYVCSDSACSNGAARVLDTAGVVGQHTAIAVGTRPLITYYDVSNGALKLYVCTDSSCTSGASRVLDSDGTAGLSTDIAFLASGTAAIVYSETTSDTVRLYICNDPACDAGYRRPLTRGALSTGARIAAGTNAGPLVVHKGRFSSELLAYRCFDDACLR